MWMIVAILTVVLSVSVAAPTHAGICLYDGNDAAFDACQYRNRQRSEERTREYNEELRRGRDLEERREQWRREELQRGEIIRQLEELGRRRGR